jgi:hypothetical protein
MLLLVYQHTYLQTHSVPKITIKTICVSAQIQPKWSRKQVRSVASRANLFVTMYKYIQLGSWIRASYFNMYKIQLHLVGCIYTYWNTMHGTMNIKIVCHYVTNNTTRNLDAEIRPGLNTKTRRFEIPFSLIYLTWNNSIWPELSNICSTRSAITALSVFLTFLASAVHYVTYCRIPEWVVMQLMSRHKQ